MGKKFRALDLFCGAGGAAVGLYRAGFDVVGIDNRPQPRYPFPFIQADALRPPVRLEDFDLVWASPPCQGYSIMRNLPWLKEKKYPLLIDPVRVMLREGARLWTIENVMGAKLPAGWLCGEMFGLPFYRHRAFESNFFWMQPCHPRHKGRIKAGRLLGNQARQITRTEKDVATKTGGSSWFARCGAQRVGCAVGHAAGIAEARAAMGVEWMRREECGQAVPPAYSEHIGRYAMMALEGA